MDLKKLDYIYFHDASILRYEKNDNDILLEFDENLYDDNLHRLIFKNVKINENIDSKIAYDLIDAVDYIDTGEVWIFSADYYTDDDNKYHFMFEFVGVSPHYYHFSILDNQKSELIYEEKCYKDKYATMEIICDEFIYEEVPKDIKLLDKYNKDSDCYKINYNLISNKIDQSVIDFINDFYLFRYACYDDDDNILLYFKGDHSNPDKYFYLKLDNAKIELLENDRDEEHVLRKKFSYMINSDNLNISIDNDDNYRIGILISRYREIVIRCNDIKCYEYDNNKFIDDNKISQFDKVSYHDSEFYNYNNDGKNITFELKDGWKYNTYYKFELKNVIVQVMNNKSEYVKFVLDRFNNLDIDDSINLFSGEVGLLDEPIDNYKYYLKLWIRYPGDIKNSNLDKEYKLGDMDVTLCDDYDDVGNLYIKFVVEDIFAFNLYPLLDRYSRHSVNNINNLYKYRDKFDEKTFKFFSVIDTGMYIYYDFEYKDNNLIIIYRNFLDYDDIFSIKFINILENIDMDELNIFINNMMTTEFNYYECIRIIKCVNDKYVVGLLLSKTDEIVFSCSNVIYDGKLLNVKSILD